MYQSLKEFIRQKAGLQRNSQELQDLETRLTRRLDFLSSFVNLTWPARLELDEAVLEKALRRIKEEYDITGFNTAIHKNDLMFAFHLNSFPDDPVEALFSYYRVGYTTAENLLKIAENFGIKPGRLLDFGSGYGRVSRFLPSCFPDADCVVSEVKAQAIDFQEQELSLSGVRHGHRSEEYPHEEYELILALSVFTHLPQTLFRDWMQALTQRLRPTGAMVFTFLDQARDESREILKNFSQGNSGFEYIQRSEDSYFNFVADHIRDDQDYGSSFITRDWLGSLARELNMRVVFLDYQLVSSQDAAIFLPQ